MMLYKNTSIFAVGLFVILMLTTVDNAWADCWYKNNTSTKTLFIIPSDPLIYVPRDAAPGTLIHTFPAAAGPTEAQLSIGCTLNTPIGATNKTGGSQNVVGYSNTFPIGTSGVGFRWRYTGPNGTSYLPPHTTGKAPSNASFSFPGSHFIELVKIGDISGPVTFNGGYIASWKGGDKEALYININRFTVSPGTCQTDDVHIDLGEHPTYEISDAPIGSTFGGALGQIPVFNCPTGISLSYSMTPLTSLVSGQTSVVTLDASSTARGLGIAVSVQGGQPAPFYTKKSLGTVPSTGTMNIPVVASMMKLGNVTPGSVSAAIEFTLFYE